MDLSKSEQPVQVGNEEPQYHRREKGRLGKILGTGFLLSTMGVLAYNYTPSITDYVSTKRQQWKEADAIADKKKAEKQAQDEKIRLERQTTAQKREAEYRKQEYLREREELARKKRKDLFNSTLGYIVPSSNESKIYELGSGDKVEVYLSEFFLQNDKLKITLGNDFQFISNKYKGDFSKLTNLFLNDGGKWEEFNSRDLAGWQKRYEDLVIEIYNVRKAFEENSGKTFDERVGNKKP